MQVQRQIDELLAHRASDWFERLPQASEAERAAFAEWLGESRVHVQAFLEIAEIEFAMHRMDRQRRIDVEDVLRRLTPNVVTLGRMPPLVQRQSRFRRRRVPRWLAAAAIVGVALIGAVSWEAYRLHSQFETAVGEQRTVELPDSSVITLNAVSRIEVNLQHHAREVELREGEAIFTVAHDPGRPFRVHTRAGVVQAIGTQFNVSNRQNGDTRVSVLEGRVQLESHGPAKGSERLELLHAGEEADIRLDGSILRNAKAIVANSVAWRQRRLVFNHAALADMVAEFNRYNRTLRLRLEDVQSDVYRFDGIFDAADPESFVSLLEKEPDLLIERQGNDVLIRQRMMSQP